LSAMGAWALPAPSEVDLALGHLAEHEQATVGALVALFADRRHGFVERGLLWLVKFAVIELVSPPEVTPADET
ncbi:MAG: hypothetical protein V4656_18990, partial [Pseudomonadota bacterium]